MATFSHTALILSQVLSENSPLLLLWEMVKRGSLGVEKESTPRLTVKATIWTLQNCTEDWTPCL